MHQVSKADDCRWMTDSKQYFHPTRREVCCVVFYRRELGRVSVSSQLDASRIFFFIFILKAQNHYEKRFFFVFPIGHREIGKVT